MARARERMIWEPAIYQLAERFSVLPSELASLPASEIRGMLAYSEYDYHLHQRAEERAKKAATGKTALKNQFLGK